jgi:FKBP-type peptidyl-prolyl cis-trans isomerase FkpA
VTSRFFALLALTMLAVAGGCSDTPTIPSSAAPYSQTDLRVGTGATAAAGTVVTLNYTAWLFDPSKTDGKGLQFDTSVGKTALTFTLGSNPLQVIQGFDRGVTGMKVGGARRIVVPPSMGYGEARNNSIPPYATLVFEVDLVDVTGG